MKHSIAFGLTCVWGMLGCMSSGKDDALGRTESFLEALERGVRFEDGEPREGDIPGASAKTLELKSSDSVLELVPGDASIMPLDVDNPDEPPGVAATLLQFEGAEGHTAVPSDRHATSADAGGAGESLHIENPFTVAADICVNLCNRVYKTQLLFAVELDDGSVSVRRTIDLVLDCTDTGNPDRCEGNEADGRADAGGARDDAGAGTTLDAGGNDVADAGGVAADSGASEVPAVAPQIGSITPASLMAGAGATLAITGTGFEAGAVVVVDGVAQKTTVNAPTELEATVTSNITADAGSLAVYVENTPDDPATRSNVLYLLVEAEPGAPVIYDYSPDNGIVGDTVLIIASNLAGQTLQIEDAGGTALEPGPLATISWPTAGTVDTVEVVLPTGVTTGPITLTTALGSYKGKIFSVGRNLTRSAGTVVDSSTQYNDSNWGRASGADNKLATSFFTANGDCATDAGCTTVPWYRISFAGGQEVARIAMRGNREYASGYDFVRGRFEVLDASDAVLWKGTYDLPPPDRDLDIVLPRPVSGVRAVKFTSLEDESTEPGFSELEVFDR